MKEQAMAISENGNGVHGNGVNGNGNVHTAGNGTNGNGKAPAGDSIPYGWSQIGVHDLVPKLGYREYWYPAIKVSQLGRRSVPVFGRQKPVRVKMLGEDIILFWGKDGKPAALWNRCPHRGALLSGGWCEFEGTVSCPYHGYTFNGDGECVAALTEGPEAPIQSKLRVRSFPTAVLGGVVWVWMGQTEPVPLEEDVPPEFLDPECVVWPHSAMWPMNWSLTIENSGDSHNSVIHRFRVHRIFNLSAFHQLPAYWSGVRIIEEADNHIGFIPAGHNPQQAYYPGLGKKWPQRVWWRFMKLKPRGTKTFTGEPYGNQYRLPAIARVDRRREMMCRFATPMDETHTMMWTFPAARVKGPIGRFFTRIYLATWFRYFVIMGINQLEDLPVQRYDRLDTTAPQKLGANDRAIIYWRRRMPLKSRDNLRVWKKGMHVADEMEAEEQRQQAIEVLRETAEATAD
jgi:phenylpropionate dioxygenase-like ring-hydroxylating dioxygenase large terminal subunit